MYRRSSPLWGVLLILMLALAACQPATPEASTGSPESTEPPAAATAAATEAATAAPTEPPTSAPSEATPAPAEPTAAPAATPVPGATSAPQPTPPWQIPGVQEDDWVSGPEDAGLTIVEYSDFQ